MIVLKYVCSADHEDMFGVECIMSLLAKICWLTLFLIANGTSFITRRNITAVV